jgi:restriction system protein
MGIDAIFKGWEGELKTKFINWLFLTDEYKVFNNIIIQTSRGSTQIDHVAVSKYGVFVIETKEKTGWIFGEPNQNDWTQVIFKDRFKFQNPLRQNYAHIKGLSEVLKIDCSKLHPLVFFWGDCEFMTEMPNNVFKGGLFNTEFRNYIKSKDVVLLSQQEIDRICSELTLAKENSGFFSSVDHVLELKKRYAGDTQCPKCNGILVKRSGGRFLGCSNYPRCRYTKNI